MNSVNLIIPEIFLSLSIMALLMMGVFFKKKINLVYQSSLLVLLITFLLIVNNTFGENLYLFHDTYKIDLLSKVMKSLTIISAFFIIFSSHDYVKIIGINKIEYPILILSSVLGMIVMISAYDLMVFYVGLELQSLSLYVLASFNRDNKNSSEAGLKYFVLSALSSGLLLYGSSLIYGFTSSTNFGIIALNLDIYNFGSIFGIVFIIVGLAFKISAVPFHMWAPDVYEGSPTSVTYFFSIVPKIAGLTVFIRFLYIPFINVIDQWQMIIIFISIASMILGSVAAIGQNNIKRLIAYSSIGHMGFILAGLATATNNGIQNSIIYLIIYGIMNMGLFTCIFLLKRKNIFYENLTDLSGMSKNHPLLSLCMLIFLFSLAGIPPLAGFFAKFYIFMSVIEVKMYFLAITGLLTTVISAFYYLRIIKIIYFDEPKEKFELNNNYKLKITLFISSILILTYFMYPNLLIKLVADINII
tara:strand:- start:10330 stop:11745 length:1416 start_codon:yes stop_codon:yes gene_type:complete